MREIKFRAWDKKNKYMFGAGYNDWAISKIETHDFLKLTLDGIVVRQMSYSDDPSDSLGDLETETDGEYILMQFTGLHDKNGVDVYDGDIVQIIHPAWRENATVEFSDGSFIFKQIRGERSCIPGWTFMREIWEVEVIGNIYENPELL